VKERNAGVPTFVLPVRSCVSLMNCMTNWVGTAPALGWAATMECGPLTVSPCSFSLQVVEALAEVVGKDRVNETLAQLLLDVREQHEQHH
jgi:hypothetical protein